MVEEKFTCPNCGEGAPWTKTVAHYLCLKCGNIYLHDWAIDYGFAEIRPSCQTTNGGEEN